MPLVVEFCSFVHIVSLLNFKLPWLFRCIYFYLFYQEHTARLNKSSKFRNILKNTCISVLSRKKSIRKKIRETFSVVFFLACFFTFFHVEKLAPRGKKMKKQEYSARSNCFQYILEYSGIYVFSCKFQEKSLKKK